MEDPLEATIAAALDVAGIKYVRECDNPTNLDFGLESGLQIEVKAWHSPRISDQMSRAHNVIAVQGPEAVLFLASLLIGIAPNIVPPPPCDSGRLPQGGDGTAPCEASQNGAAVERQSPTPSPFSGDPQ